MPNTQTGVPEVWAQGKQATAVSRWQGDIGAAMRDLCPRSWPGVPVEAWMGFIANSTGPDERTSLDERGLFGVEGPNWPSLARDPATVALLGREAVGDPGWMGSRGGLRDQIAAGLVDLHRHLVEVGNAFPALRPAREDGLWAVALAFIGWSAGTGNVRHHLGRYAAQLAAVPEASRWGVWCWLLAGDLYSGAVPAGDAHHDNQAYSVVRTMQKLSSGRLLARATDPGLVAWFDNGLAGAEGWVQAVLAAGGYGGSPSSVGAPPATPSFAVSSLPVADQTLTIALGIAAVAAAVVLTYVLATELTAPVPPPWRPMPPRQGYQPLPAYPVPYPALQAPPGMYGPRYNPRRKRSRR